MTYGERVTAGAKVAGKLANPDSSVLVGNAFASCGSLSYIVWGVHSIMIITVLNTDTHDKTSHSNACVADGPLLTWLKKSAVKISFA